MPKTIQEEQQQREEMGWKQRKAWRLNGDLQQASRLRGAHAPKRPLPKLEFPEDE